jgi:hypothetical protein
MRKTSPLGQGIWASYLSAKKKEPRIGKKSNRTFVFFVSLLFINSPDPRFDKARLQAPARGEHPPTRRDWKT